MAKVEAMVAVESFAGDDVNVTRAMEFPGDHPIVLKHRAFFVPASGGEEAMAVARAALERENENRRERHRAERVAEARRVGTRPLPSDDLQATAAKRAVHEDHSLELVIDDNGLVTGARKKR